MLQRIIRTPKRTVSLAQSLRKRLTTSEKLLWQQLRRRQFHGYRFRRQTPLGPYIVDFLCVERMLVLEVDGDSHHYPRAKQKDQTRSAYLRERGFTVIRFSNSQIVESLDDVLEKIGDFIGCYDDRCS
tara:strand:+ start:150 stop:533 length:384 start_codon:yes stop_codon:yes gene_type:complete